MLPNVTGSEPEKNFEHTLPDPQKRMKFFENFDV